jgi:pimeloyl-ACP methyl ester carboxylesterase
MAERGYGFLGWNTRFRGNEAYFLADHALADIGVGVKWLREVAGVERVVLFGNSGGGSLMAAYQSQAVKPSITAAPGLRVVEAAMSLTPGDLYVSVASHPGRPEVLTAWMDPSVTDEHEPIGTDPDLDMYDERNGPPYRVDFIARYRAAQVERNRRISAWCHAELGRLASYGVSDRLFVVRRTWADLRFVDGDIDPSNRKVPLCYAGDPKHANSSVFGIGAVNTLRTWLSMWSLDDSPCSAAKHLPMVTLPALVIQADADSGVFPSDAAGIHDGLGSTDKQLLTLTGDHYFLTPDTARDELADTVAAWVAERS